MLVDSASDANITLEPGRTNCNTLTGAPLHSLHQVAHETELYLRDHECLGRQLRRPLLRLGSRARMAR